MSGDEVTVDPVPEQFRCFFCAKKIYHMSLRGRRREEDGELESEEDGELERGRSRSRERSSKSSPKNGFEQKAWQRSILAPAATYDAISDLISTHGHEFDAETLATAVKRMAKMKKREQHPGVEDLVDLCRRLGRFDCKSAATVAMGMGKLNYVDRQLFEFLADQLTRGKLDLPPEDIAGTVQAFAIVGVRATALFAAVASEMRRRKHEFTADRKHEFTAVQLAVILKSFALIDWPHPDTFVDIGSNIDAHGRYMSDAVRSELFQVAVYIQGAFPHIDIPVFSSSTMPRLRSDYQNIMTRRWHQQMWLPDISKTLTKMGWNHTTNYATPEGIALDCAQPELRHAIQVVGVNGQMRDVSTTPPRWIFDGKIQFIERLLCRHGWNIVYLSSPDWQNASPPAQRQLLQKIIDGLPSSSDATPSRRQDHHHDRNSPRRDSPPRTTRTSKECTPRNSGSWRPVIPQQSLILEPSLQALHDSL